MAHIADIVVGAMADWRKDKTNMIHPMWAAAFIIPMWVLTNRGIELQVICTVLITLNSLDRLLYPSCYNPASSSKDGILYSPFTARTLATLAEYHQYWVWATWIEMPFQGHILGNVVVFGETICWCGLLFQSKTLHWCEDATWTVHASLMTMYSRTPIQKAIFGFFVLYMILEHLPRAYRTLKPFPDCKKLDKIVIKSNGIYEKAWQVPVLVLMPLLQTYIYYDINNINSLYS